MEGDRTQIPVEFFGFSCQKWFHMNGVLSMSRRNPPAAAPLFPSGFYVYGQPAFLSLH